ncbi:MAG: GAF domain-containing protein [Chloroflexi bacterium]|nr:GAF domain-containing protein [Chloroflexota bacterium]
MMDHSGLIVEPEWKQYLHLGEQILILPGVKQRCELIEEIISNKLSCYAKIWLVEPLYPLPGEEETETIPSTPVAEIVSSSFETRKILFQLESGGEIKSFVEPCEAKIIAYPIMSKNLLMAVIYAEKPDGTFCPDDWSFLDGFLSMAALTLEVARQVSLKNWRASQLTLVQTVSEQIANMTNLDDLCQKVTGLIHELFEFYYVAIYIKRAADTQLRLMAMQHNAECGDFEPALVIPAGQGIIGSVAQTGQELLAADVRNEPRYRFFDCLSETRSELALPLKTEERIYGVLDLQSDRLNGFHENDVIVLRALANNIALAIESAGLYNDLQQRVNQVETIIQFSQALTSILDMDKLTQEVTQLIHQRFGYPYVHLFTIHPVQRKILFATGVGERSEAMRIHEIAYDLDAPTGIIPWVARHGQTYLANDISIDTLYKKPDHIPATSQSELALPLIFAGEVMGVLDLQSDKKNEFNEADIDLMEALASSVAIALRNARMYRSDKWRAQVADSFREVSELISANKPLKEVLEIILLKLEQNLPCDGSALWLAGEIENNSRTIIDLAATRGVDPEKITQALEDKAVLNVMDTAMERLHPSIRNPGDPPGPLGLALGFPDNYSSIVAPLRAGDKPLGILALAHHTPGRYGNEAYDMTSTFASYAAVAIQNARLFEEAQDQAWVSTVLLQVAEAIQSAETVDELLTTMVRLPPLLIGVRMSAIFLWKDDGQVFELRNWYGFRKDPDQSLYSEDENPAFTRLNTLRSAIFIQDPGAELNFSEQMLPEDIGTMVMVPLLSRGNLLGSILVGYRLRPYGGNETEFNQQILAILQGISQQTAVALENLRLEENQEEDAYVTAVLLEVAQAVVSQNELDDVLETIVHLMPILVGIDACVIYSWDKQRRIYQPVQAYAGNDEDEIHLIQKEYAEGEFPLLDTALTSDHLHFSTSGKNDLEIDKWVGFSVHPEEDLSSEKVIPGGSILLSVPLSAKGEAFGILLAKETMNSLTFQEKRMEIITGIGQQVALAIQNDRYTRNLVETQRMEQEMELARQSQRTFLPGELPRLFRWDLAARWTPARQVGGDFYDIIQLNKDHIGLVIADVADKGMAAALYMTVTRTLIRAYAESETSPALVLEKVNNLLLPDSQDSMFVTAVYAILNKRANKIVYANAGHNLPVLFRRDENRIISLEKGGMSLGVMENIQLTDSEITIFPGDILLMYTDGVTEAFNSAGEGFGIERLEKFILDQQEMPAEDLLKQLENTLKDFSAGVPASDDVTLVCLKRQS